MTQAEACTVYIPRSGEFLDTILGSLRNPDREACLTHMSSLGRILYLYTTVHVLKPQQNDWVTMVFVGFKFLYKGFWFTVADAGFSVQ